MNLLFALLFCTAVWAGLKDKKRIFYFFTAIVHANIFLNSFKDYDIALNRLAVVFFFVFFLVWFIKNRRAVEKDLSGFLLIIFILLMGLSLFYVRDINFGLRKFIYFLSLSPAYFIVWYFTGGMAGIKKVLNINMIIGGIVAFLGVLQFFSQIFLSIQDLKNFYGFMAPLIFGSNFGSLVLTTPSWFVSLGGRDYFRAISIFPDPHTFSLYLGFCLPTALIFLIYKLNKNIYTALFCAVFSILALLLTFARGGYISFLAFLFVLMLVSFKDGNRRLAYLKISIFLLTILLLVLSPLAGDRFFQTVQTQSDRSVSSRIVIAQDSFEIWKKHFFFGTGIGNYPLAVNSSVILRSPINAHNTYLEIAVELGLAGIIIWLFLFTAVVLGILIRLKKEAMGGEKENYYIGVCLLAILAWFAVNSFFETALYWPVVFILLMENLALGSLFIAHKNK